MLQITTKRPHKDGPRMFRGRTTNVLYIYGSNEVAVKILPAGLVSCEAGRMLQDYLSEPDVYIEVDSATITRKE